MIMTIQSETQKAVESVNQTADEVHQGVDTTAQAGASLKEIIRAAEQVGDMVTQIATATTHQSSATEQVNANVEQMTRLIRQSEDGTHQKAKACGELSSLALDLEKIVEQFRVNRNTIGSKSREIASRPPLVTSIPRSVPPATSNHRATPTGWLQ